MRRARRSHRPPAAAVADLVERGPGRFALDGSSLHEALGRLGDEEGGVAAARDGDHEVAAGRPHGHGSSVDGCDKSAELGHCVDPEAGLRTVRRSTAEPHPDHREPAQRPGEREIGGLTDETDVRSEAQRRQRRDDRLAAPAGVLLVGDQRQHDAERGWGGHERLGRRDQCRHAPFMSAAPRPLRRSPSRTGANGAGIPVTPTVSRCPFRTTVGSPLDPGPTATRLGRPEATAWRTCVVKPARPRRARRCRTISVSPAAPGTRPELTLSMATSSAVNASAASATSL